MEAPNHNLEKEIKKIVGEGIKADLKHLKKDMCSQFSDPREWAREYVVNAYDAQAKQCTITGLEENNIHTIVISDDGMGMDKKRILDFFTLYRSVKDIGATAAIGRHGIGKLSIAAIPGQCKFKIVTSNGKDCWQAETGNLLDDDPLVLQKIKKEIPRGTTFSISFEKKNPLKQEMEKIKNILARYVQYLPMAIIIFIPVNDDPASKTTASLINKQWLNAICNEAYSIEINDKTYNLFFTVGIPEHAIYQNRIFITGKYNLLSYDMEEQFFIPYLNIAVDSPHFELPFGRHCLMDESVLKVLAPRIRNNLLPRFYETLAEYYNEYKLDDCGIETSKFEEMTCSLMKQDTNRTRPWFKVPVFRLVNGKNISFLELMAMIEKTGVIYIEDEKNSGIDYTIFEAPVLKHGQPHNALTLIMDTLKDKCLNLATENLILEAPASISPELGEAEKKFQGYLGFHPNAFNSKLSEHILDRINKENDSYAKNNDFRKMTEDIFNSTIWKESIAASYELETIAWKVNYLVQRDGKTPCNTHKFLFKNNTVILNLYHPEITELLKLSKLNPQLAGHWAISLCLCDKQNILPHLSAECREDLLLLDAMAKAGNKGFKPTFKNEDRKAFLKSFRDFLRNSNSGFPLN